MNQVIAIEFEEIAAVEEEVEEVEEIQEAEEALRGIDQQTLHKN
jgi:hypothetical protein